MSLVADPDYVLRVLQLQYLRRLPDPLGPSTLTFPPSFSPYIDAGDLSNPDLWPELNLTRPPKPVSSERIPGVGGLKYSDTIVGKHGGMGAGMRVHGRRRTIPPKHRQSQQQRNRPAFAGVTQVVPASSEPASLKPVSESEELSSTIHEEDEEEDEESSESSDEDGLANVPMAKPPTVTIQSPATPQAGGGAGTSMAEEMLEQTPKENNSTGKLASQPEMIAEEPEQEAAFADQHQDQDRDGDGDDDEVDSDFGGQAAAHRSRPVTLLHTPEYAHDKELSDALLWEDGESADAAIIPTAGDTSSSAAIIPDTSAESSFAQRQQAEDDSQASTVDVDSAHGYMPESEPMSYSTLFNNNNGTANDSFKLVHQSSANIIKGASEAALQSRRAGRLRRGGSEPELAAPDTTANEQPQSPSQAAPFPPPPLPLAAPNSNPPPPAGGLPPPRPPGAPRRERRRVNISTKGLDLGAPPPPPPSAPAFPPPPPPQPQPAPAPVPAVPANEQPRTGVASQAETGQLAYRSPVHTPSPTKRARAGTDPPPASSLSSPSSSQRQGDRPYVRRQASSDAVQPSPSSLAARPPAPPNIVNAQGQIEHTSPLKPLALLTPRSSDDRLPLSRKTSSPAPLSFSKLSLPLRSNANEKGENKSALSAMMAQQDTADAHLNPFTSTYGALVARGSDPSALSLKLFFSASANAKVLVSVKGDLTAEEVIGCGLYKYWELGLEPPLVEDKSGWDGESLTGRLDPAAWNLHIVEDEDTGEVDDDFPALDRTKAISAFSFNAFAIVPASAADIEANRVIQAQIQRRPSRIIGRPNQLGRSKTGLVDVGAASLAPPTPHQPQHQSPDQPAPSGHTRFLQVGKDDTDAVSTSLRADRAAAGHPPSSHAAQSGREVLLRIRIPVPGLESVVSTVKVTTQTYLADVVETICKKRKEHLGESKNWVLMLGDRDMIAPLDRTVESLQDNFSLRLVNKANIQGLINTAGNVKRPLANTNPSASIFKRLSEPPQPRYVSASDVTPQRKRWRLFRKHAMSLTKHERILSIDDDQLQFLHPSGQPGRTPPYHISQVMGAKPSKRVDNGFKLFFFLDREVKRYDLEVQDPKDIAEIIAAIEAAKQRWKAFEGK